MDPKPEKDERTDEDAPLRESEVTAGDRLDDRVEEGEGLPGYKYGGGHDRDE